MEGIMTNSVIEAKNLSKWFEQDVGLVPRLFGQDGDALKAVQDVYLSVEEGEIVGLVGESGSGKTTLGLTLLQLHEPTSGTVRYRGQDLTDLSQKELNRLRDDIQIIYQNPFETLNPRLTIDDNLKEPLKIHDIGKKSEWKGMLEEVLESVGLTPGEVINRFPDQLSGGQRQRVSIARTLLLDPDFIVADEPVSMLDVSVQADVLRLLKEAATDFGVSMLYISHNLATVSYLCDYVHVMYLGRIVESGPTKRIIENPKHPYTQSLISAIPEIDPRTKRERTIIEGQPESPINLGVGCNFANRCPKVMEHCRKNNPERHEVGDNHTAACFLHESSDP